MRAIRVAEFGAPSVMSLQDVPKLSAPGAHECVVKIHSCGVNPVDTYIRSGTYGKLPELPYTPGKDGAGVVEEVGSEVQGLKVGDRVYVYNSLSGSYAQSSLCRADHVYHLPESVSFAQGACLGTPAFTAYRALFEKGRGRPGDSVFVHGASGGVGLIAIQLATAAGLRVTGTASSAQGRQAVLQAGAVAAFDHSDDGYLTALKDSQPSGFDICIEMLANSNLGVDLPLMAQGGRVCVVGSRGPVQINPRDMMTTELEVHGIALMQSTDEEIRRASSFVTACLQQGSLKPIVSLDLPFTEASAAHVEVMEKQNVKVGNIVLSW